VLTVPTDKTRDGTYYTQREVLELPTTRNPPRDRRPPQKYSWSIFEINCVPIDTELSQSIKTKIVKVKKEEAFKEHHTNQKPRQPPYASTLGFWQAYMCCIMLMFLAQHSGTSFAIYNTEELGKVCEPVQMREIYMWNESAVRTTDVKFTDVVTIANAPNLDHIIDINNSYIFLVWLHTIITVVLIALLVPITVTLRTIFYKGKRKL
jgi:hypothetical protein